MIQSQLGIPDDLWDPGSGVGGALLEVARPLSTVLGVNGWMRGEAACGEGVRQEGPTMFGVLSL